MLQSLFNHCKDEQHRPSAPAVLHDSIGNISLHPSVHISAGSEPHQRVQSAIIIRKHGSFRSTSSEATRSRSVDWDLRIRTILLKWLWIWWGQSFQECSNEKNNIFRVWHWWGWLRHFSSRSAHALGQPRKTQGKLMLLLIKWNSRGW